MQDNRRGFIKKSTALAAMSVIGIGSASAGIPDLNSISDQKKNKPHKKVKWPVKESADTPKLCMPTSFTADEKGMRRIKQIGIDYVLMGGPRMPWTEVVEYNFYVHRLTEGYQNVVGRGGSGYLGFNYDKVKDLPPNPDIGVHSAEELWANLAYFLKAVIPVAEKAGVRMALHPNDPPPPITQGSAQIMGDLKGWKRLIEIVDSPSNGITFDCGVTNEIGEDPVEVARYFGSRDRINHQHFRNSNMEVPREKYVEQFVDEGDVNMFAVMQELVKHKYRFGLFPEHPHGLDADKERGGDYIGYVYNVGYARAMLQAVLSL